MKKDFLSIDDIKREEMFDLFELTEKLKRSPFNNVMKNKFFCLFFEKPSTRTRMSFDVGIQQMGGKTVYIDAITSQLSRGETIEDTVKVIERYVNAGIVARVFSHKALQTMSEVSELHVINALSDLEHPCQTLADLFTIKEKFQDFKGLKLAWVGDGDNVCNSLLLGCTKVGMDVAIATPKGYEPDANIVEMAKRYATVTKAKITFTGEPEEAVKDANIVTTDTFVSMGDEKERDARLKAFLPKYQVDAVLMERAAGDALFMHCLPAHRDEEVSTGVLDGSRSIVFDQAENRLHTQKALLIKLLRLESLLALG